jgi:hypothetical protein
MSAIRAWIAKWVPRETVTDTYDVRASIGSAGDAFRDVASVTAARRLREQRLALNAADGEGADGQNDKKEYFHGT